MTRKMLLNFTLFSGLGDPHNLEIFEFLKNKIKLEKKYKKKTYFLINIFRACWELG